MAKIDKTGDAAIMPLHKILNIKKLLKALVEGGRERKPAYRRYDDED